MSRGLRKDSCSLQRPGAPANEVDRSTLKRCIPAEVQYACRYWVQHLQRCDARLYDNDQIHKLLQKHFLHWLETLSLIEKTSDSVQIVTDLQPLIVSGHVGLFYICDTDVAPKADGNHDLHAMIYDAKRFILYYQPIIEKAPLQLYSTALIFASERSVVRERFLDESLDELPRWITGLLEVETDWSALLQTLEGHSGWVNAVAFSLRGMR